MRKSVCTLMQQMPGKMENVKNDAICHITKQNQYNPAGGGATMTDTKVSLPISSVWICLYTYILWLLLAYLHMLIWFHARFYQNDKPKMNFQILFCIHGYKCIPQCLHIYNSRCKKHLVHHPEAHRISLCKTNSCFILIVI